MQRLRKRQRLVFSGFTKAEVEKMKKLRKESDQKLCKEFFQKVAKSFSYSAARAGKPAVKWNKVQNWFEKRPQDCLGKVASSTYASNHDFVLLNSSKKKKLSAVLEEEIVPVLSEVEYEARSSKDGAWYDVDILSRRKYKSGKSGKYECHVRFIGFGVEEDEWVDEKNAVRQRSIPLENSDCQKLNIGDVVCCFQERSDEARYFDARIQDIKRKRHVSDCRCLFSVRYDHDNTEERVPLKRLCYNPTLYKSFMR